MNDQSYVIDGENFDSLEGFCDEVWRVIASGESCGTNLDAFNDILSWPSLESGIPYTLIWRNSAVSRERWGYGPMAEKLRKMLTTCHPTGVPSITDRLTAALSETGPTLFDWLVEIIEGNKEYVVLRLE